MDTTAPVTDAEAELAFALLTVSNAEMACGAVLAGGASRRPMVQLSPWLSDALVAQPLLEIVMRALVIVAVKAPVDVVELFVTVNSTSAPTAPGPTDPRAGPPAIQRPGPPPGFPLRRTEAAEPAGPISVIVNEAVSVWLMSSGGLYASVMVQ